MSSKSANSCSESSSIARPSRSDRLNAQIPIDAQLDVEFENSEQLFDYSTSVDLNVSASTSNVPSSTVSTYLRKMQRGSLVQSFGCMIAIDDQKLTVLAYSENAAEMLDLGPHAVPSMEQQEALTFGTDVRSLFESSSAAVIQKACNFGEVTLLNPVMVQCKHSGKQFYAILHRIDVGLVIDLEPVDPSDTPVTTAGSLVSYKLAAKAISRLQSLPSGNISLLCDVLVREVSNLTGYDRVMVYKFHDDEHGEVIAESRRPDLEPYLGLHYPATDIPQASRFLFMKNKVRMICDCLSLPVKVVQDKKLKLPLSLSASTLRFPHGCHAQYMANMGSIASLVMSVTINEDCDDAGSDQQKGKKLWGLVVCHHTSPRFVAFPLRYACEFLLQVFGVQVSKEVELAAQLREKDILQTQTVLCSMLLRDAPVGIVAQSPNVMDLVKCDGAALYYKNKIWSLGITPTEAQIRDIAGWLLEYHKETTGLSTDSLLEAGYPGASSLGDAVCGMAATQITSKDFLFWFRPHTAKKIQWGGAKHNPGDSDDTRRMHPRSSFNAYLEVVKNRSLPWEDVEMDAIHSLQCILRESLQDETADDSKMIVDIPSNDTSVQGVSELHILASEMVHLIETASAPIFAVDHSGTVNGWNTKVAELTGLDVQQAIGMKLTDIVAEDSIEAVKNVLVSALQGSEERNLEIKLKRFGPEGDTDVIILVVNSCCSKDMKGSIVGVCFLGQDVTGDKLIMDKYAKIQGDYVDIVRSPCGLIPPIFMMDDSGRCLEWSRTMQNLTGLKREEAIDRMLLGEVFTVNNYGCRVKDEDTLTKLRIFLSGVSADQVADKLLFRFYNQQGNDIEALLTANKRTDAEGRVTGVLCFLHVASPELQYAMQVQKISEQVAANSLKRLTYIRHEIRNPLNGVKCIQNLMSSSNLTQDQSALLRMSILCQNQLSTIIDDTDIGSIEECYKELGSTEFNLRDVLDVVVNQVMILSREREVQITCDAPAEVASMYLYGDNARLQQVLSEFLTKALIFTPAFEGSTVLLRLIPKKKRIGSKIQIVHLEFRIMQPAPGIPESLIQEMFHHSKNSSREGLGLYINHKLVKIMNGTVQYLREAERSSFIILVEFPLAKTAQGDMRAPVSKKAKKQMT